MTNPSSLLPMRGWWSWCFPQMMNAMRGGDSLPVNWRKRTATTSRNIPRLICDHERRRHCPCCPAQADGQVKNRPIVLLRRLPPFGDFLVCGVSTQIHQRVAGFDETIVPTDGEFPASGLKAASLIRLGFLAVLPESAILGKISSLSTECHQRLLGNLCRHLGPQDRLGKAM